jgi:hypothetical protein
MGSRFLFFLLKNGLQHIAGLRDFRKVDLRLGCGLGARPCRSALAALEVRAYTLGFIFFQRTGVRFLLCDAYGLENIKNRSALDFQFTC